MTSADLSNYHLQFVTITSWLIEKNQLGILEQQQAYVRAFQPQLLSSIMNCLQLKYQDHHLNTPYKIEHVYEAACVTVFNLIFHLTLHLHSTFPFSDFTYIISLIPGHESLIYDSFCLSLTHVHCFDSL
jgi:hypothetical protein